MKKNALVAVLFVATVALTGCGGKNEEGVNPDPTKPGSSTVTEPGSTTTTLIGSLRLPFKTLLGGTPNLTDNILYKTEDYQKARNGALGDYFWDFTTTVRDLLKESASEGSTRKFVYVNKIGSTDIWWIAEPVKGYYVKLSASQAKGMWIDMIPVSEIALLYEKLEEPSKIPLSNAGKLLNIGVQKDYNNSYRVVVGP